MRIFVCVILLMSFVSSAVHYHYHFTAPKTNSDYSLCSSYCKLVPTNPFCKAQCAIQYGRRNDLRVRTNQLRGQNIKGINRLARRKGTQWLNEQKGGLHEMKRSGLVAINSLGKVGTNARLDSGIHLDSFRKQISRLVPAKKGF